MFAACDQNGIVSPETESAIDLNQAQRFNRPMPAGLNVNPDSVKFVTNVSSLNNSPWETTAQIQIDFWDKAMHDVSYQSKDSMVTYTSTSEANSFRITINNVSGEMRIRLNDEQFYIPPFHELKGSDAASIRERLGDRAYLIDQIIYAIQETRIQTLHRSSDQPRIQTVEPQPDQLLERNATEEIDSDVLARMAENTQKNTVDFPGFFLSPYFCCIQTYESFGGSFGSSYPAAYNGAIISIQAGCSCQYCLGCSGYLGPDVYPIVPFVQYWAEGCGQSCVSCDFCW